MPSKATSRGPLRLGIFGGTFDPVHHGHLLLARDALEQARLSAVLFVPCAQSPHKTGRPRATNAQRLAMLRGALRGESRFWLSRCEIDRPGPSYAIDTVREIAAAFPRAALSWLIGADQLARLTEWGQWDELRQAVTFLVFPREANPPAPPPPGALLRLLPPRRIDISATDIRRRVKSRLPIDYLVPPSVASYIARRALYA
jgi:nicotinate-nucleotide adenylyltransferase